MFIFREEPDLTNCYVVGCGETKEAIIIDPGFGKDIDGEEILKEIHKDGLKLKYVIITHGHPDHVLGVGFINKATGAKIMIHEDDSSMLFDPAVKNKVKLVTLPVESLLQDGDSIRVGKISAKILHTPGHTAGSIFILMGDAVFTGDTLFMGSIGLVKTQRPLQK